MSTRIGTSAALACAACVAVGAAFLLAERHHPFGSPPVDPSVGQALFERNCAACHAVSPDSIGGIGPSLAAIGRISADRVEGLSSEAYLAQSILEPDAYVAPGVQGVMSAGIGSALSDDEIRALIGYLMTLGGAPDARAIAALDLARPASMTGDGSETAVVQDWQELRHGHELFAERLGCSGCHGIFGSPGSDSLAPSLERAGLLDEAYLVESIRDPSAVITPTYRYATVDTVDGTRFSGRVLQEDGTATILLVGLPADPQSVVVEADRIGSVSHEERSRMPPYQLSERDERALVSFLRFLTAS